MSEVSEQLSSLIQETLNHAEILGLPKDEAFYLLGNTLSSVDEFEQALKAYSIAIKENPANPEYYHNQVSALKRKIYQDIYRKIEFESITEKEYIKRYEENWGSRPKGFRSEYGTVNDKEKKFGQAFRAKYPDIIEMYLKISRDFPDYGKVHLSLASTYIEIDQFYKAVESYQNFLWIYEKGKFVFNPRVGGINQQVTKSSGLETIILTSVNYPCFIDLKRCYLEAFHKAQALHLEKSFWYTYADNGRASVSNREEFQHYLHLINIDGINIKIPEYFPNEISQKIVLQWHNDKINSIEGQFWQSYSQGGYDLVRTQEKFKEFLEFINYEKWDIQIPNYLPDEIQQKILSHCKKEKLNTNHGQFWQSYSQGGYELVRTQEKFKEFFKFISTEKWDIQIPNYLPDEIQQKILSNWKKEKLNTNEGQFWQSYSQGGYELVRTQEKFKEFLEFINYDRDTLTISDWVSNELKEKIIIQWQKDKQQIEQQKKIEQKNRQKRFKLILCLGGCFLGCVATVSTLLHIFTESAPNSPQAPYSVHLQD